MTGRNLIDRICVFLYPYHARRIANKRFICKPSRPLYLHPAIDYWSNIQEVAEVLTAETQAVNQSVKRWSTDDDASNHHGTLLALRDTDVMVHDTRDDASARFNNSGDRTNEEITSAFNHATEHQSADKVSHPQDRIPNTMKTVPYLSSRSARIIESLEVDVLPAVEADSNSIELKTTCVESSDNNSMNTTGISNDADSKLVHKDRFTDPTSLIGQDGDVPNAGLLNMSLQIDQELDSLSQASSASKPVPSFVTVGSRPGPKSVEEVDNQYDALGAPTSAMIYITGDCDIEKEVGKEGVINDTSDTSVKITELPSQTIIERPCHASIETRRKGIQSSTPTSNHFDTPIVEASTACEDTEEQKDVVQKEAVPYLADSTSCESHGSSIREGWKIVGPNDIHLLHENRPGCSDSIEKLAEKSTAVPSIVLYNSTDNSSATASSIQPLSSQPTAMRETREPQYVSESQCSSSVTTMLGNNPPTHSSVNGQDAVVSERQMDIDVDTRTSLSSSAEQGSATPSSETITLPPGADTSVPSSGACNQRHYGIFETHFVPVCPEFHNNGIFAALRSL